MSKEKLTVEKTVYQIQSKVFINKAEDYNPQKHGEKKLTNLLKQIKDEIISSTYSYNFISQRNIENVFNKYLNEKGGK